MTTCDVVARARQYVGTRFVHQGRSAAGLDCLGLLLRVAEDEGLQFAGESIARIDVPTYGMRPDVVLLQQKLARFLLPVAGAPQVADVVLLKVDGSPQHLAILTDYPMPGELGMIHAYAPARKVVEHRYDTRWRCETYAVFRLPQLV